MDKSEAGGFAIFYKNLQMSTLFKYFVLLSPLSSKIIVCSNEYVKYQQFQRNHPSLII